MADWNTGTNNDGGDYADGGGYAEPACDHGDGEDYGGGGGGDCRACGQPGHFARECPDKPAMVCHSCQLEGHMAKECPNKTCKNCGLSGHVRQQCENARVINRDHVATVSPEDAWAKIKQAVAERDVDDAKEAVQEYMKAMNGTPTYRELQEGLIGNNIGLWFIPLERQLLPIFTNMDLQGNMGKKWSVSYRFSDKPERPVEADGWPGSREEILARLDDAGDPSNSGKSRCSRCGEVGHIAKECAQEPEERKAHVILCYNCNGEGHRVRDCPEPRVDKFACRNCNESGHRASDCPTAPKFDCRNCGKPDHKAADCTEPRNMELTVCRNCEKTGHMSRDCDQPKDWSKVICSNCSQPGHTKVRCKQPIVEDAGLDDAGGFDNPSGDSGGFPPPTAAIAASASGADSGWQQEAAYAASVAVDAGGW